MASVSRQCLNIYHSKVSQTINGRLHALLPLLHPVSHSHAPETYKHSILLTGKVNREFSRVS